MDNVVNAEKLSLYADHTITEVLGYAAGSEVPVASKVYSTAGSQSGVGGVRGAGEVAALTRYSTSARSTKNHPIYLFNYYHGPLTKDGTAGERDTLLAIQKTTMGTYAAAWIAGFSDGTITATRTGPQGHPATGYVVEEFVTHRDFPYTTSV
jgi:hypothetical protein